MNVNKPAYAIITPVRDENRFIKSTLECTIHQSIRPVIWIIVDDGSTDNSAQIISEYAAKHQWIVLKQTMRTSKRLTGSAEIVAFNFGLTFLKDFTYDFIVKLDADLSFDKDYFDKLLGKFDKNEKLGIASGVYTERSKEEWNIVSMPEYHASGASKVIIKSCFNQIGGFVEDRGWDTIDEIKAMNMGWETANFPDLLFYHLKNEGTGMGMLSTSAMQGEIYFRTTGGGFTFFALKFLSRLFTGKPLIFNGLALLYGYVKTLFSGKPLLVSQDEARTYRKLLNSRIFAQ
jgi:glycosyltransferase involved in cell wall biosynthesis